MNLRRFVDDWHSVTVTRHSDGRASLHDGPPVTLISYRLLKDGDFHWGDYGYLPVYKDHIGRHYRAVWPLPLWALHVIGHGAYLLFWGTLRRLHCWGLVVSVAPEGCETRIRDLRWRWPW